MSPDFENDVVEPTSPSFSENYPSTTTSTVVQSEPRFFRFSNEFCRVNDQPLSLSLFENVPDGFIYSDWATWSHCDTIGNSKSRNRSCQTFHGAEAICDPEKREETKPCTSSNLQYCYKPPMYVL